ncbi:hypothetical protein [Bradyrhizobium sp. 27S5]|uniref:hypothetical protein n=1 Tax=Bradyrhizobium sp. 27S5 TaxID=3139728 RepID=UPI0030D4B1D1
MAPAYRPPAHRPLNSSFGGRDGAPKRIVDARPVPGQRRQTKPSHDFLHGAPPLDDEKEPPLKSYEKPIPIHNGMSKQQVDKFHSTLANHPTVILQDAANLVRKMPKPKPAEKS